jgi:hypothetical protein
VPPGSNAITGRSGTAVLAAARVNLQDGSGFGGCEHPADVSTRATGLVLGENVLANIFEQEMIYFGQLVFGWYLLGYGVEQATPRPQHQHSWNCSGSRRQDPVGMPRQAMYWHVPRSILISVICFEGQASCEKC